MISNLTKDIFIVFLTGYSVPTFVHPKQPERNGKMNLNGSSKVLETICIILLVKKTLKL